MTWLLPFVPFAVLMVAFVVAGVRVVRPGEQGILWRYGKFSAMVEPGWRTIVPLVERLQRVAESDVLVVRGIAPGAPGRVRIGSRAWDALSSDNDVVEPSQTVRLVRFDGEIVVVAARR